MSWRVQIVVDVNQSENANNTNYIFLPERERVVEYVFIRLEEIILSIFIVVRHTHPTMFRVF